MTIFPDAPPIWSELLVISACCPIAPEILSGKSSADFPLSASLLKSLTESDTCRFYFLSSIARNVRNLWSLDDIVRVFLAMNFNSGGRLLAIVSIRTRSSARPHGGG
jgi:hypothetical protein